ncbi:MAG: serine/threonine protein kinase [Planctomycetes bacterium]|nr:serine/threonine protein kinase [Planctomycetota bacterium]
MDDLVGKTFGKDGRFEVLKQLGEGGVGSVWLARDTKRGGDYAIKFLMAQAGIDPDVVRRFSKEGQAWRDVRHPGLVRIHGLGRQYGSLYVVSEFIQGRDLGHIIEDAGGPLELDRALRFTEEAALALQVVHDHRMIHRDIKPENLMIRDEDDTVKIVDFGMVKYLDSSSIMTAAGYVMGTPGYVAPEHIRGDDLDGRADTFALGCVLYETLTGIRAFKAKRVKDVMRRTLNNDPTPLRSLNDVGKPIAKLVDRMLAKRPARRPSSMKEVADEIAAIRDRLAGDSAQGGGLGGMLRQIFEGA